MQILLVEDNQTFADLLVYSLEGLNIHVVSTLAAAKAYLCENRVGMVILDLGLPDSSGLNTLRALDGFKVPKVIITANFEVNEEAIRLGASDFIVKGGDVAEMYERILFNVRKLEKRRQRFEPEIFEQLKACLVAPRGLELAGV